MVAGGFWDTTITLVNTAPTQVTVQVLFRVDDGSGFNLPLKVTQAGSNQTLTTNTVNATINPNSTLQIATGALPSDIWGWGEVLASGPINGFAVLRSTPPSDKPSEATVPMQAQYPSTVALAYDNTGGYKLGVALANLSSNAGNIAATAWDANGAQLGTQQIPLAANGHTAFLITDKLGFTAGNRGVVLFQNLSGGGVSALGLRFSPAGPFTSMPVIVP